MYNCIRLVLQFAIVVSLFIVSLTLSPANGISTNVEDNVQEERDGYCSLSDQQDGNCQLHDDTSYNVDDTDITNSNSIDENHLQNLFEQAMKATQSQDYNDAISIFTQIYKLARTHYEWKQMKMIHYMHGMTLLQLKQPSTALYYFKSAMMLAEFESNQLKEDVDINSKKQEFAMFMQQVSTIVMGMGKQVFIEAHQSIQTSTSNVDIDLIYAAVQYAHAVNKIDEAYEMINALQTIQPNHIGALLEIGLIANQQGQDNKALDILRQVSSRSNELNIHEQSSLYHTLAALECKVEQISHTCVDGWYQSFITEINMLPINRDYIATTAAVNVCNIKLKLLLKEDNISTSTLSTSSPETRYNEAVEQVAKIGHIATNLQLINHPLQLPQKLIRDISFAPYPNKSIVNKAVQHLEDNFEIIQKEIMSADKSGILRKVAALDHEGLHTAGEWKEFNILAHGKVNTPAAIQLLPNTLKIILELQDATNMVLGGTKVSLMQPGTIVRPHTGQTNARLRIHLGVAIPDDGPRIRVGNETRSWIEGKCLVIDDSYVHEVWHPGSKERRIVLIVDVWHPEMNDRMRRDSLSVVSLQQQDLYQRYISDTRAELRRQGVPEDMIPQQSSILISDSE